MRPFVTYARSHVVFLFLLVFMATSSEAQVAGRDGAVNNHKQTIYTNTNMPPPGASDLFGGDSVFAKERIQFVYTQADLLQMGLTPGAVIDTLAFTVLQRNSGSAYSNFEIRYYYTAPAFSFSPVPTGWANQVAAGGTLFSGTIDLSVPGSYYIPPSGGVLNIPIMPLAWPGTSAGLVLDICWEASGPMPADPVLAIALPGRRTARVRAPASNPADACTLMPGNLMSFRDASFSRPNIYFGYLRTTPPPPQLPVSANLSRIEYHEYGIGIIFEQAGGLSYRVLAVDLSGRRVASVAGVTRKGVNRVFLSLPAIHGMYLLKLKSPGLRVSRKLVR